MYQSEKQRGTWTRHVYAFAEFARSAFILLILLGMARAFVFDAFRIPSSSMEGTLLVGDFLLVDKTVYGAEVPGTHLRLPALSEPRRADVVVFHPPHALERYYVKRIVGLPGDTLRMRDKQLYVNGLAQNEPYVILDPEARDSSHPTMSWQNRFRIGVGRVVRRPTRNNWGPIIIPEGRYFVLGDNRDNSEDSRYWGLVDREEILGRPWRVYYSFDPDERTQAAVLAGIRWGRIGGRIQ